MENMQGVDMPAMPTSLRKMLTVTRDETGNDVTSTRPTPPSALLTKLDAFLPRLAQANQALSNATTPPAPDILECVSDSRETPSPALRPALQPQTPDGANLDDGRNLNHASSPSSSPSSSAPQEAVEMDLFVDNSLGQLVPSVSTDSPQHQEAPLVRELPDNPRR